LEKGRLSGERCKAQIVALRLGAPAGSDGRN